MESNVVKIRREILIRIAKAFFEDTLLEKIDRIPLEMRPRNSEISRCCVYKDRVMIKYRILAALGFGEEDETDELTPLNQYAKEAIACNEVGDKHLTILSEVCSACIRSHYQITNVCRGCVARPCTLSCAKNAISVVNGKAIIDEDKCVNCGKCMQVCPYQAIIRVPIPCEEVCPTGAISKDESGKEKIDFEKCILCGKCINACPFGSVAERSQIIQLLKSLKEGTKIKAIIAPSIIGQFPGSMQQLHSGLLSLGFDEVIEAAIGADITALEESNEFIELQKEGKPFITSSCCPAYVMAVKKHANKLIPFVSNTSSPMILTARMVKEKDNNAKIVFIGPCIAKRMEAKLSGLIDFTITFEELGALFIAKGIDIAECEPLTLINEAFKEGRAFPISGGVVNAIKSRLTSGNDFRPFIVNGLDKKTLRQLPGKLLNQNVGNFIEVMTCEGGCIAGPSVITKSNIAMRSAEQFAAKSQSVCKCKTIE